MRLICLLPRISFAVALSGHVLAALAASPQPAAVKPTEVSSEVAAACERSARQAIASPVGQSIVTFNAAPVVQSSLTERNQAVLRGAGHMRGAGGTRNFSYSCNVDLRTAEVAGVVVRNPGPATGAAAPRARAPIEPDLSHLSPQACESRAAAALKDRWPSVSNISFDSATRRLLQDAAGRAELHGQGRALPAANLPVTHFGFDCVIDPRDGRVLGMQLSG